MNFTIYTKRGCPSCDKIKRVMSLKQFNYITYELGEDFTRSEFYEMFGQYTTFPQVLIGDHNLGGCSETIAYLRENSLI